MGRHKKDDPTYYVYFARSLLNWNAVKIGVSCTPGYRVASLYAEPIMFIEAPSKRNAYAFEKHLHDSLPADSRIIGEWFMREDVSPLFHSILGVLTEAGRFPRVFKDIDDIGDGDYGVA